MLPILTDDGSHTLTSETFGVTYHSRFGAVTESAHVFIGAGLRYKAVQQQQIRILETGFGTGLNAFMTWIEAEKRALEVHYCTLELFPVGLDIAQNLNFAAQMGLPEREEDFLHLHHLAWENTHRLSAHFSLCKKQSPIETFFAPESFDLIYFDAFSPQAQPELWTEEVFQHMYASLASEGALVTYCAQGEFKRCLKRAGFEVERLQGPPGKREMTRAVKP